MYIYIINLFISFYEHLSNIRTSQKNCDKFKKSKLLYEQKIIYVKYDLKLKAPFKINFHMVIGLHHHRILRRCTVKDHPYELV